jgi:hypothetical protein
MKNWTPEEWNKRKCTKDEPKCDTMADYGKCSCGHAMRKSKAFAKKSFRPQKLGASHESTR